MSQDPDVKPCVISRHLEIPRPLLVFLGWMLFFIFRPAMSAEWIRCAGPTGGVVHDVVVSPDEPSTILAASLEGLLRSNDAGSTWTYLPVALSDSGRACFLCVSYVPGEKDHLYAGTFESGLWESRDGGTSWNLCLEMAGDGSQIRSLAVDSYQPRRLFVGTSGRGPFLSTDGGETWRRPPGDWRYQTISALCPVPMRGGFILAAVWGQGLFMANWEHKFWKRIGADLSLDFVTVLTLIPSEERLLVATYGDGLFHSPVPEFCFQRMGSGLENQAVTDLLVDPRRPETIYLSSDGGGIFQSSDGGQSWRSFNLGLDHKHVYALALSRNWLYAGTCWGGIYRRRH